MTNPIRPRTDRTQHSMATLAGAMSYYFDRTHHFPVPATVHPRAMKRKSYDNIFFTPETYTSGMGLLEVDFFQKVYFSSGADINDPYCWLACTVCKTWRPANPTEIAVLEHIYAVGYQPRS